MLKNEQDEKKKTVWSLLHRETPVMTLLIKVGYSAIKEVPFVRGSAQAQSMQKNKREVQDFQMIG